MRLYKIKNPGLYLWVYYFLIYSFIGWSLETAAVYLDNGYYQSRGFIYGPFCIIYGFGMLLLIITLSRLENHLFIYFILATLIIAVIEYSTGRSMEAVFNTRWWDYSNSPFNVNGYICLKNSIIWGLLSLIMIKFVHPKVTKAVNMLPVKFGNISSVIIFIFLLLNIILSIRKNLL